MDGDEQGIARDDISGFHLVDRHNLLDIRPGALAAPVFVGDGPQGVSRTNGFLYIIYGISLVRARLGAGDHISAGNEQQKKNKQT